MASFSGYKQEVNGGSLNVTPILRTWQEVWDMDDVVLDGTDDNSFWPLEIYDTFSEIVIAGNAHPKYPNAFAQNVVINPRTPDSSTHFRVTISYAQPGILSSLQVDTYQQSELRNFTNDEHDVTINGETTKSTLAVISYVGKAGSIIQAKVPSVANVQVPSLLHAIRVVQYEAITDQSVREIQDVAFPLWNEDPFLGYEPGQLLYMGVKSTCEGANIYRREYTFLVTPYEWHHFYSVWVDQRGLAAPDIKPYAPGEVGVNDGTQTKNGAGAYKMLDSTRFADLLDQLKPPYNGFV